MSGGEGMTESFFRRHSRHYPIRRGLSEEQIKAVKEQERQMIPLGRRGDPDDVARWVVIFSDPEKNWITGQIVAVDGGLVTT
jgi:NAD(P)-dependent dehydrogenase (short-subunit alcohol dehydrogenase family)